MTNPLINEAARHLTGMTRFSLLAEAAKTKYRVHDRIGEDHPDFSQEHLTQAHHFCSNDYIPFGWGKEGMHESVKPSKNSKALVFHHDGPKPSSTVKGLEVPRHMWEGGNAKGGHFDGMEARNKKRAKVYGSEARPPLNLGQIESIHKDTLADHFSKPREDQVAIEEAAVARLKKAGHLDGNHGTLQEGEKTDTVQNEHDEKGRSFTAMSSKGVAGHALYTSGTGVGEKHHIINTCPGQTQGCGGGVDANGIANTHKGTCFAPKAERQYVGAAVGRAAHEQAKFDPAMTKDWVLAHAHSLRKAATSADRQNKRFLFRPNVVDETDRSSRYVIKHLNKQRAGDGKPPIVANSYGKTNELHDPDNHYHVTFSNVGPKVKHGQEIAQNRQREKFRVTQTIHATDFGGKDLTNDEGNKTPPKNSYMVTNMRRGGAMDKDFQKHVTHAKYWGAGRDTSSLAPHEKAEGLEGHFDGEGKPTTPEKSHYGHMTITGSDGTSRRYDYQKQHILHPRLVQVKGASHPIPTDSRFKDNDFLPPKKKRFKSKNGKIAGGILVTTPTTSTNIAQHHSAFTHDVGPEHIEHAKSHGGEYEIDNPYHQEAARGKEYAPPQNDAEVKKLGR